MTPHTTVWYEIQYSVHGADDWFTTKATADTQEAARVKLDAFPVRQSVEYRVVKVTRVEEEV